MRSLSTLLRRAYSEFSDDDATTHAAALSFYTSLSLAPLIVILLWITSFMSSGAQSEFMDQLKNLAGPQVGSSVDLIIENIKSQPSLGSVAGWLSFTMVILSAGAVFRQLQGALNSIWDVEAKPEWQLGVWLRKRLLSIGMALSLGFLMLVSLALSAFISFFTNSWGAAHFSDYLIGIGNVISSLAVFTLLFAGLFRFLPDILIEWRDVWFGAAVTAVLFTLGKYLIGTYLGQSSLGSAYGAAGSFVILLMWLYYSSIILLFGAEVTQVAARLSRRGIRPEPHATRVETEVKEVSPSQTPKLSPAGSEAF